MKNSENKKWYDKAGYLVLWLFICWPVAAYGFFKSNMVSKNVKIGIASVFGVLMLIGIVSPSEVKHDDVKEKTHDFSILKIEMFETGTNIPLGNKSIKDKFYSTVIKENLGGQETTLVQIHNKDKSTVVSYYKEKEPNSIRFLDMKIENRKTVRWRVSEGHDLFIFNNNPNELKFIFGDRKVTKTKGTVKFIK